MASHENSIKHLEKTVPLQLFKKLTLKGILPDLFYEVTITLIPKPNNDTLGEENYRPIIMMNIDSKILNKILAI